ncbi:MAG: PaaI family thioesterase [Sedimentisphaerales bacterium]|nr:PaaI family thioesterase [Sedimentisphaerales bacterium]
MGLQFRLCEDGSVEARFACRQGLQGYTGVLHGGITSSLLDGAMTNCLFAHGIVAVTGRMTVRFRHPIKIGVELVVRAKIVKSHGPIHALESQVIQQGIVMAAAAAKFMEQLERNQ